MDHIRPFVSPPKKPAGERYNLIQNLFSQLPAQMFLCGLQSDLQVNRTVSQNEASLFAAEIGAKYVECSAKTGENLESLLEEILVPHIEILNYF